MFDNIGKKIKNLAIIFTIVGIIASISAGIVEMVETDDGIGLIIMVGGSLLSWVSSFLIYGFGEMADKLCEISKELSDQKKLSIAKVMKKSEVNKNKAKEMIEEVISSTLEEAEQEEDVEELYNGDIINKPEVDECPYCFYKIKPTDKECPNCGYKLK